MRKLSTKVFLILTMILLGSSYVYGQTAAEQPPGDGSAATPWDVSTLAHLRWISENDATWGDTIIISADIDAAETRAWNDGKGFSPIGDYTGDTKIDFTGNLDGQGHVIYNMYINRPDQDRIGLIGRNMEDNSVIKNLGMENARMTGDVRVGAIAGEIDGFVINCYSTGIIHASERGGGVVGFMYKDGDIYNSYSTAHVTATTERAGGIVGGYKIDSLAVNYASGQISSPSLAGGLLGRPDGGDPDKSFGNYWDIEKSQQENSSGEADEIVGEGFTTDEMKKQATFAEFDFTGTWAIIEDKISPYLQWQNSVIVRNDGLSFGSNSTSLKGGIVVNLTDAEVTFTELGYVYGIDSLPWLEGGSFSHGTKMSTQTNVTVAAGADVVISGGVLPKIAKEEVLYATAYAIDNAGMIYYGDVVSASPPLLSDGSGTAEDPYQISTIDQLNALNLDGDLLDKFFIMMNDIDAADTENWNDGEGWSPIGGFNGNFDGQGFDIINLYINRPGNSYTGLFGRVDESEAIIKNLGIVDADVTGKKRVGILVGRIEDGAQAINCHTSGIVKGNEEVGGLAGRVNGDGYLYNCFTTAMTYGSDDSNTRVGGFTGACFVGGSVEMIIQDCYSTGAAFGGERIGGFIGNYLTGEIYNSYSTGDALGDDRVGGFIGNNQPDSASKVEFCYWDSTLVPLPSYGYLTDDLDDHIPDYFVLELMGLTTTEMKAQASFEGWDFSGAWNIKDGVSRPYLDITDVMIINEVPVVTNQKVEVSATVHNIAAAADITEAGFIFRTPDLSWSDKVADASFSGPVAVDGSGTISVSYDDVLEAGNYYSVQSYATDANGMNYYGDASFVYIEQEVYDVTVVVHDELSAAVAGASVTLGGSTIDTDASGEAVFTDVVAGSMVPVKVVNAGYDNLLTSTPVDGNVTATVDLSLTTYTLDVNVTDTAGTALQEVNVEILGGSSALTDATGQVSFAAVTETSGVPYELTLDGYVTVMDTINVLENTSRTIEMEPRSALVEVLDDNGDPVENATVTISGLDPQTTDITGKTLFSGIPIIEESTLTVVADSFNIFMDTGSIENESVEITADLEPTMVRFVLTDENGDPLPYADVVLGSETQETGEWGHVDFERVASGVDVAYTADKFGYAEQTGNVNLSNANDTIELQMSRNLFNFTFTVTSGGETVEGAEVLLQGVDTLLTDAEGMVLFENLPIGDHAYTISKGLLYEVVSGTLSVVDQDGNEDVSLTALTYTLTFNVTDGSSNAIEGASVTLSGYGLATTGENGAAVYADVAPAENMIYSVNLSGYDGITDVVTVTDADKSVDVTMTAVPYDVTLSVVDGQSAAVEGATVSIAGMDDQTTDASGNVTLTNLQGNVSYTVSKDGYDDATGELTFADNDQTVSVTLTLTIGIDNAKYDSFVIYPNPSTDYVNIQVNEKNGNIAIYDITGRVVINETFSTDLVRVDFTHLNAGTYFMKILNDNGMLIGSEKVIIQK